MPMDTSRPPNFSGNYPLAGERIGPAWRVAWRELVEAYPRFVAASDLVALMTKAGPIEEKTAENLLRAARQGRVIAVKYVGPRKRARYRVIDRG